MIKIILPVFILLSLLSYSQNGSIKGFIYDKDSGEPILFTNVVLKGTRYGAATDVNGYYSISRVPKGEYTLLIKNLGYETLERKVIVKPNNVVAYNMYLKSSSIKLDDIIVSGEKAEMRNQIHTAVIKISPRQIEKIPSIGAQADIAQYLQVLPGVVFTGDQGGQLYIRGGAPIENKVMLDGMTIYNPFHSIGMFSVFDNDLILNADVYSGGFNAQYGGRISSIMDIKTRQGNKKHFAGKLNVSTFATKLLVEGPLKKFDEKDASSITYAISLKHSYLDETSKSLYSYANENGLPFNFTDGYGKVSITGKSGNKLNVFGFSFNDKVKYMGLSNLNWKNNGIGLNAIIVPSESNSLIEVNVDYSTYKINLSTAESNPNSSGINDFGFSFKIKSFVGSHEVEYGAIFNAYGTDYSFVNSHNMDISNKENTSELGAFIRFKGKFNKFLIDPGIRFQYYASLSEPSIEPRLGIKYLLTNNIRLKASAGLYSQNLIPANSQRSVVDLFYGFLSSPESLPNTFDGQKVDTRLQKAQHVIAGVEYDLNQFITFNLEGYYKHMYPLIGINTNKQYGENTTLDVPELLTTTYMIEKGDAYGVDLSCKYDYKHLYLWSVVSFSKVEKNGYFYNDETKIVENISYPPHFDRRLSLNLVASYTFGNDLSWEVSARWNYGSGFPFTATSAFYEKLNLQDVEDHYTNSAGELGIIYGDINGKRLTSYHRLDLNLKKIFYVGENSELNTVFSITNVYNRKNIFYVNRLSNEIIYQLPIMPSFGLSLTF